MNNVYVNKKIYDEFILLINSKNQEIINQSIEEQGYEWLDEEYGDLKMMGYKYDVERKWILEEWLEYLEKNNLTDIELSKSTIDNIIIEYRKTIFTMLKDTLGYGGAINL